MTHQVLILTLTPTLILHPQVPQVLVKEIERGGGHVEVKVMIVTESGEGLSAVRDRAVVVDRYLTQISYLLCYVFRLVCIL